MEIVLEFPLAWQPSLETKIVLEFPLLAWLPSYEMKIVLGSRQLA